jgi:hypothetical protein
LPAGRPSAIVQWTAARKGGRRGETSFPSAIKNAPSRCRLRPAIRLTSAEASATRRTINLGRSVLGASRTLGPSSTRVKVLRPTLVANCDLFFSPRSRCAHGQHALNVFAEENGRARRPGRKNSPSRERFCPPSRQTVRFRVVLLGGLRPTGAPCSAQRHSMQIRRRRSRSWPKESGAICTANCPRSGPVEGVWGNREVPPASTASSSVVRQQI